MYGFCLATSETTKSKSCTCVCISSGSYYFKRNTQKQNRLNINTNNMVWVIWIWIDGFTHPNDSINHIIWIKTSWFAPKWYAYFGVKWISVKTMFTHCINYGWQFEVHGADCYKIEFFLLFENKDNIITINRHFIFNTMQLFSMNVSTKSHRMLSMFTWKVTEFN